MYVMCICVHVVYVNICVRVFCHTSVRIMKPRRGCSTSVLFITTYDTFPKYGEHVTVARVRHVGLCSSCTSPLRSGSMAELVKPPNTRVSA